MSAIDVTVVAVAFPHFMKDLHTNVLWAAWTISVYAIGVTAAMPLAGNLSDSFGRKKVFIGSSPFSLPVLSPAVSHPTSSGAGNRRYAYHDFHAFRHIAAKGNDGPPAPTGAPGSVSDHQPVFTAIFFVSFIAFSVLGRVTVSTPFLNFASILSVSTTSDRGMSLVKHP